MSDLISKLPSKIDATSIRFEKNMRAMAELVAAVRNEETQIRLGGGAKAIESQHNKKRLTARERINLLIDRDTEFFELGLYAAYEMYEEWGGAPSAGVVTGLGRIHGRLYMLIVNDATVKAGAFFPMTAKKVIRAQNIAIENHIPTVYLVDSAGVFLPLQEDVFPDTDDFGRVFRNNAVMSAMGIPQITAIMGMCVAGGAYLPVMCDTILMTEGSGLFLAGPALVQAAIGAKYSAEELGGAQMHAEIAGTIDYREANDQICLERLRSVVSKLGHKPIAPFSRIKAEPPAYSAEEIYGIFEADGMKPYDVKEIIARVVDAGKFDEYKAEYGKTIVCGLARIGGFAVGIVANQASPAQQTDPTSGAKRTEFGRVIYTESAEKAARFIMDCNQNLIPLVFLHDVNGFMVGRDAEWSGIIKAGAKMVNAVANSVVPKITVIIGGSFGAGHYAMCGKAYDPRFLFAWPTARYAVMSGASAAGTLAEVRAKQVERGGKVLSDEERTAIYDEIKSTYDAQADPRYGAARLWIDAIIDPANTRQILITALEACSMNPDVPKFNPGVLQT
ncbi:MAG TPA: acyl-CoA carboxylase subunit beta [Candidatus Angelobacter sp.]|nr:acyl-CoA carboxylase subunit beta [Candidatus Angelobacter sp.]